MSQSNYTGPRSAQLLAALKQRILILDGAMGTMIQRYKLAEADYRGTQFADWPSDLKGNNDLLNLTQPHIITEIHEAYLAAGADIIETNTFSGTTVAMADYGMQEHVYAINLEGTRIARAAADRYSSPERPRFVAAVLGPTGRTCSISPDVNDPGKRNIDFDQLVVAIYDHGRPLKNILFSAGERVAMMETALRHLPNVRVESYSGLTVDYARSREASVVVRGLRVTYDFEFEYQRALTNKKLDPEIETISLMTSLEYAFLSSSMVKEIAALGGCVQDMVPSHVQAALRERTHSTKTTGTLI